MKVIDRCTEPGCKCDDRSGTVLYNGNSLEEAINSTSEAKYGPPEIELTHEEFESMSKEDEIKIDQFFDKNWRIFCLQQQAQELNMGY